MSFEMRSDETLPPNLSFNADSSPAGLELLGLRQWRRRAG